MHGPRICLPYVTYENCLSAGSTSYDKGRLINFGTISRVVPWSIVGFTNQLLLVEANTRF